MKKGIGSEFIEKTQFRYIGKTDQMSGLPQPPLELPFDKEQKTIALPDPKIIKVQPLTLRDAIENRESLRVYSDEPLTLEELSFLLWCTQGVTDVMPDTATYRTVPSAGARHALETYLLVNNVSGLLSGLYRYLSLEHTLLPIDSAPDIAVKIYNGFMNQPSVKASAVTFLWAAVPARMNWRYGERGCRYLFLDAGHVCQNLYLSAEAINCGACAIGAFFDDKLNEALGIDDKEQFIIYLATLGKKR